MQLANGLERKGHEVRLLGRRASGVGAFKLLFPVTVAARAVGEVRRFRPDVVQVHESDGALAALTIKTLGALVSPEPLLCALLQVSYCEEFRAVRPIRFGGRVLGRPGSKELRFRWFKAPLQIALGCLTVYLADRVLAPSARTAAELRRDYGAGDVAVVPNATEPVAAGKSSRAASDGPPTLLFVGRLRLRKGLEVALEALRVLDAGEGAPSLLIVGDGEHRQRLEARTRALGLEGRVTFAGRQPREQVEALMDRARVLVVPSLYEGMPLVIVEAMQRGLPVVASAVSGIPEVVIDGETGWLVPSEDPSALAAALGEACRDAAEAERRGERGRDRLVSQYSPERVAETWERAIGGPDLPAAEGTNSR